MDRRQRKTRRSIFDAFELLIQDNHYHDITVAQIIDQANIGRSTFYAHFDTKEDLLQKIFDEFTPHVFYGADDEDEVPAGFEDKDLYDMLVHVLFHLTKAPGFLCMKLIVEGEPYCVKGFNAQMRALLESKMVPYEGDAPEDFYYALLTASFREVLSWWLIAETKPTPEQMATWFISIWNLQAS